MSEYILELKDVVKTFGGVKALNGVHFQLKRGEIHPESVYLKRKWRDSTWKCIWRCDLQG